MMPSSSYASQTPISHFPNPDPPSLGLPCMQSHHAVESIHEFSRVNSQNPELTRLWNSLMPRPAGGRRPAEVSRAAEQ